jgi:hypothetical protein
VDVTPPRRADRRRDGGRRMTAARRGGGPPGPGPGPEIVVDIERLVLTGLDGLDGLAVAEAFEGSLAALLAAPGWDTIGPAAADLAIASVQVRPVSRARRSLGLAADVARAVDGVVRGGDPAGGPRSPIGGRYAPARPRP